jgi:precorrin-6Y C5,15-methyltransferase (decarboxylating)
MRPWLSIIGIGEDGHAGLSPASRAALDEADIVFGGARHLTLAQAGERGRPWPLPFSVEPVLACRGRRVAVLASGDPFWFGVGGSLAQHLEPAEWRAFPSASTFSLIAARLGWRLEETLCLGLHAAPLERLATEVANGRQVICLMRDGNAVPELGLWLSRHGWADSDAHIFEAVGGPGETLTKTTGGDLSAGEFSDLVAVALKLRGGGGRIRSSGLADDAFLHDGQITKRPVRAMTLSALAPRAGQRLWDIGAGSGSISVEWLLAAGERGEAIAIEPRADRAATIRANASTFGVAERLTIVEGKAPAALAGLAPPDAVFVGGGASDSLLHSLWNGIPAGTRLVVNAVTLETEALVMAWSGRCGGELLRIELARAEVLGGRRGWRPARPIVQWIITR